MYYVSEFNTRPDSIVNASYIDYSSAIPALGRSING